jgi:hypothetical protein
MHDVDAKINEISGQQNYMESLSKVTGDMFQVNMAMYKDVIINCNKCDFNLYELSKRFLHSKYIDNQGKELFTTFMKEKETFDLGNSTFTIIKRKSKKNDKPDKEVIANKRAPKDVVKSNWFKLVRDIEKSAKNYLNHMFGVGNYDKDNITETQFQEALKADPALEATSTFFSIPITHEDGKMFTNVAITYKCARKIINAFMDPMYDVRKTIEKNYNVIEKVFKSKAIQASSDKMGINCAEDIINILHKFIIAKYRVEISSNNKHYGKLFRLLIDDTTAADVDGAKFLNIMDSINLEQLNKDSNTYKFAASAREIISNIVRNEGVDADEITERIGSILNPDTTPAPEKKVVVEELEDIC